MVVVMAGVERVLGAVEVGAGAGNKKGLDREVASVQRIGLAEKLVAAVQVGARALVEYPEILDDERE